MVLMSRRTLEIRPELGVLGRLQERAVRIVESPSRVEEGRTLQAFVISGEEFGEARLPSRLFKDRSHVHRRAVCAEGVRGMWWIT